MPDLYLIPRAKRSENYWCNIFLSGMLPLSNILKKQIDTVNMKKMGLLLIYLSLVSLCACQQELVGYGQGDLKISIEQGEEWLHDFPLFLGIKKKNPPQIAVWLEDTAGNYLSTVYVTEKAATQSWQSAGGNRRKESLPH